MYIIGICIFYIVSMEGEGGGLREGGGGGGVGGWGKGGKNKFCVGSPRNSI